LVLEKIYAHWRHPATAFLLGHARGVICLLCAQNNIKLFEYLPTRIKKAIVGRGHAGKLQVKKMIEGLLKIKNTAYAFDVSDALALAVAHAQMNKGETYGMK
jgi:crossover junction endodeoxyribonuclease RuvC